MATLDSSLNESHFVIRQQLALAMPDIEELLTSVLAKSLCLGVDGTLLGQDSTFDGCQSRRTSKSPPRLAALARAADIKPGYSQTASRGLLDRPHPLPLDFGTEVPMDGKHETHDLPAVVVEKSPIDGTPAKRLHPLPSPRFPRPVSLDMEHETEDFPEQTLTFSDEDGDGAEDGRSSRMTFSDEHDEQQAANDELQRVPMSAVRIEIRQMLGLRTQTTMEIPSDSSWYKILAFLDLVSFVMIICNAVILAVSTDVEPQMQLWNWAEYFFIVYFILELCVRLYVEKCRAFLCGLDRLWNLSDLALIVLAIVECIQREVSTESDGDSGKFTTLRVCRLLRVAKLMRLVKTKQFKELLLMVKGILSAAPTLGWATLILFTVISVLGLVARQTIGIWCSNQEFYTSYCPSVHLQDANEALFGTVPRSCFTVFRCFTEGCASSDGTPLLVHLYSMSWIGQVIVVVYMIAFIFVTFGLFNLILAVLVESTLKQARKSENQEHANAHKALRLRRLLTELSQRTLQGHVGDPSTMLITKKVFMQVLKDPSMEELLEDLEIPVGSTATLFETLDGDNSGTLNIHELIEGIMRLQGSARNDVATLVRVEALQESVKSLDLKVQDLEKKVESNSTRIETHAKHIKHHATLMDMQMQELESGSPSKHLAGDLKLLHI